MIANIDFFFVSILQYLLITRSGSVVSFNFEGFTSTRQTKAAINTTITQKLSDGLDYVLGFSPRESYGLVSQTTPDVILFFLFLHTVTEDDITLGNLFLDVSKEFKNDKKRKTATPSKTKQYAKWLDSNFNFKAEDIYYFIKTVALGKTKGVNNVPDIIAKQILLLDKKYKVIEHFCNQNDLPSIKWFLESGYEISNIKFNILEQLLNQNNIEITNLLLSHNILRNVNTSIPVYSQYGNKQTLLHVVALGGFEDSASYLVELGADVNALDASGATPIFKAVQSNNPAVVKLLATKGANLKQTYGQSGESLIHLAASLHNIDMIKVLINLGLPADSRNINGDTALHVVTKKYNQNIMFELIKMNLDVNDRNYFGNTPLHVAAFEGNMMSFNFLVNNGARIHETNNLGQMPIFKAVEGKNIEIIKQFIKMNPTLINATTDTGDTLMHIAADTGDSIFVETLLKMGAPVNNENNYLQIPLYRAALKGNELLVKLLKNVTDLSEVTSGSNMLHEASREGNSNAIRILLSIGFDVNSRTFWGYTPLHIASGQGHLKAVQFLLSEKAQPNAKSKNLMTPLHLAALGGHLEVVTVLINSCANPGALASSKTPIDLAKQVPKSPKHIKVVEYLKNRRQICTVTN